MFHFHKWSDWSIIERGKVFDSYNILVGSYILQERFCLTCNKSRLDQNATVSLLKGQYKLTPVYFKLNPKKDTTGRTIHL